MEPTIATLCQACQADPNYSASVTKHGQVCTIGTDSVSADSINETCNRLLVGISKAADQLCGASPERRAERQKRRADRQAQKAHEEEMRGQFAAAMSQEYQLEITPSMIGLGIFGLAIALWGGIPMLLLCIASVCFEHWLSEKLFDNPQIAAMGAA